MNYEGNRCKSLTKAATLNVDLTEYLCKWAEVRMWTDVFYKSEVPLGSDQQHVWRSFLLAILTCEWKTFADNDSEGETTASREARLALCTLRPHWAVQWEHQVVGHIDWLSGLPMVFFLGKTRANAQSQRKLLVSYILWYLCLESSKDVASSFIFHNQFFFTTGNILVSGLQSDACDCWVRLPYCCLREKEQDVVDLLG